jgi:hypothetical protein
MELNPAFIIALIVGTLMLGCVCFVYVKHRAFGFGGTVLSALGVILLGMSVWRSIDVSLSKEGIKAKLNQVEATAKQATETAKNAEVATQQANQQVSALTNRFEFSVAQQKLKDIGLYRGPVDGVSGAGTHESLKQFQTQRGLEVTGELDARTKEALEISSSHR